MLTIAEFKRRFPDENACRKHLFQCRWPVGYCCPRCEHPHYYYVETRDLYECRKCRMQTSITAGTLMHGSKLPLQFWFLAIFLVSSGQPCSARWLAATLQLNYRSALGMLRKIRHAMRRENGPHLLSRIGDALNIENVKDVGGEFSNETSEEEVETTSIGAMTSVEVVTSVKVLTSIDAMTPVKRITSEEAVTSEKAVASEEEGTPGAAVEEATSGEAMTSEEAVTSREAVKATRCEEEAGASVPVRPKHADAKPDAVERAKRFMQEKARTFIRRTYRRVHRKYMQSYIDEFYFRWTGRLDKNRFIGILNACVTLSPAY